ncbi:hypothetical protein [Escherichia coli]|uniref:hypothetical protein n=2 Tax=Escherichia coli TaxID=562 RepID=UPI00050A8B4D|nr:hypothetical protein [Escherichia coli]MCJ0990039.1 hypothetical protein [Escherichia coli]MCX0011538.1 hypothetical protein [Escherichia coli]MDI1192300.1 hypothetical protein [Escherichia coli]
MFSHPVYLFLRKFSLQDSRGGSLAVHSQAFRTEKACRDAFTALKKENVGEFALRGVCVPAGE